SLVLERVSDTLYRSRPLRFEAAPKRLKDAMSSTSLAPAPARLSLRMDDASVALEVRSAGPSAGACGNPGIAVRLRPWEAPASAPWQRSADNDGFSGSLTSVLRSEPFAIDLRFETRRRGAADFAPSVTVEVTP